MTKAIDLKKVTGPFEPAIIIHGGAGAISRMNLPPPLYLAYHNSLLKCVQEGQALLNDGASALDAACHAVSLMEDDPLFNCGKGSVFTKDGTIEMEASVMVTSLDPYSSQPGSIKRGAAVSLIREARHPILLAKEVLLSPDREAGLGGTDTMHYHLSGKTVEAWGFDEKGLERKPKDWFWTKRRWDEHKRGLEKNAVEDQSTPDENIVLPSQGTVGAVCVDVSGNLAVATSTGGLTNKSPGRIGDTPTLGAGFWAESWVECEPSEMSWIDRIWAATSPTKGALDALSANLSGCFGTSCDDASSDEERSQPLIEKGTGGHRGHGLSTKAVVMSGTGNGDSFLKMNAVHTAAALCRFSGDSLATALKKVAGPGGELQRSAGDRWRKSGEGQGGIIGIEVQRHSAKPFFDFNCGGLWRAWYDEGVAKVMVFKEEYRP